MGAGDHGYDPGQCARIRPAQQLRELTVVATNMDTGFTRRATSDNTGHYTIQFLPVRTYRLEVETAGFKKFLQTGIVLEVARNARIDPMLQVGTLSESVQVTADAPLVDTTKVALGQTVNNSEILNRRWSAAMCMACST